MTVLAWTKHLPESEREQYKQSLKRVSWVFEDLRRLLKENEASIELSEISPKSYENANWAYRQAHANGYKQALRDFNKLITLDPEDKIGRQPTVSRPAE